jgi:putative MATE family efflux protein
MESSGSAVLRGVTEPVPRALLRLALPVLASQLLRIAFQWVDALWVRGLGVEATAAVTSAVFVMWWVYSLNDIVAIGVTAYVSQLLGAGERERAGHAAWQGVRASALIGLATAAFGQVASRAIYRAMGGDAVVVEQGARYLSVVMAFSPVIMVALTCENVMRASGDTRTPLLLDLGAVSLNAVLAPLLIYGVGPLPALGVAGAGLATGLAQVLLAASYGALARRRHPALPIARRAPGAPVRVAAMARVGLPAALIGMQFSLVYLVFERAASVYGAAALAIVGIANRVEALQFVCAAAIGIAGASMVGQNLGAGRPDRAEAAVRTGLAWVFWIALAISVVVAAAPAAFVRLFTSDPEAVRIGVPYLRVLALCFVPTGLEMVVAESLMGSGHTATLSWIYSAFSAARIPLALVVPGWWGLGATGIAWVITVTCVVRTAVILAWAARGTWKRGLARELRAGGEGVGERPEAAC